MSKTTKKFSPEMRQRACGWFRITSMNIPREMRLARLYPDVHCPAISTVHAVLDRHGLVKRRKRRRHKAEGTALSCPYRPNDLWCADRGWCRSCGKWRVVSRDQPGCNWSD